MSYINIHRKFKLSLVVFLIVFAFIVASVVFAFHNQNTLAGNEFIGKNILIEENYTFPKPVEQSSPTIKLETEKPLENIQIRVPALMYHYISNTPFDTDLPGLYTEQFIFEDHLKAIKSLGYNTIFPRDLGHYLLEKESLPKNPIILSFDDGYEDFYTNVFPLLKKYNDKAIIYVIANSMDKPGYITSEQAKEMINSGFVEIGSHTLDHVNLSQARDSEAYRQIYESKIKLSHAIGSEVVDFAYPFGKFSSRDEKFVKKAGYLTAASTYPGTMQSTDYIYSIFRLRPGKKIGDSFINWLKKEEGK